jgi:hypothetical protein
MPAYTFEPGLALAADTLAPAASVTGTLKDTAGTQIPAYDLNGLQATITTNSRGYFSGFKADVGVALLDFGDVALPVVSVEVRDSGLQAQAAQSAAEAAQASAAASETAAATSAADAARAASLVDAPADAAVATLVQDPATQTAARLRDAFVPRDEYAVSALAHGADPTGAVDSTAALQAAVDAAIAGRIGTVYIPDGTYRVDGTVNVTAPLTIAGAWTPRTSKVSKFERLGGTVLVASAGTVAPVIRVAPVSGKMNGFRLADLMILGSDHATSDANRVDRVAIEAADIHTEISVERVNVTGFARQALRFVEVFDGHLIGCRILNCGTDNVYPAVEYTGVEENTNAIHAFGLHVEGCAYMLKIDAGSRHNQFVACKFEMYTPAPLYPPIRVTGTALENSFSGCQFVLRNADDTYFYASVADQPHMIALDAAAGKTVVSGCMFTSANYHLDPAKARQGSRWLKHSAGRLVFAGNTVDLCWGGDGPKALVLGTRAIVEGNLIYSRSISGQRNIAELGADNLVTSNVFDSPDPSAGNGSGALFTCTGGNNVFATNRINMAAFAILSGPATQSVLEVSRGARTLTDLAATPNVGWQDQSATKLFKASNTAATSITGLTGAQAGEEISLLFTNSNTTLVHSASFRLKGGANVTPVFGQTVRIYYDGATWYETGRSF